MNKTKLDKVMKKLTQLKEQPFSEVIRAGSMLCLGFGDKIKVKTAFKTPEGAFEVKESQKTKYAIHIDGVFRISSHDKILLTREDMFKPSGATQDSDFDEETFQWDVIGNNRFDEQITEVFDTTKKILTVKDVWVNKLGDMRISLSDGYDIDVFIDTNEEEECWRFFEVGNSEVPHIVMTGCGCCEEV